MVINFRFLGCSLCAVGLLGSAACQHYRPMPLGEGAIHRRLAMPSTAQLQREVRTLHNPLMPPVDVSLEAGLTPRTVGVVAAVHNPAVLSQNDALQSAEATLLQAGILPNPQITAGADIPFGPNVGSAVPAYGLGLNWEITSLIPRGAKIRAARAGEESVRLDIAWKQWQAAEAAKMALYDVVALREQLVLARQLNEKLAGIARQAHAALKNHDLTATDASAAESAAQEAAVSVAAIQRDLADATLALDQAVGFPPEATAPIAPDIKLPSRLAVPSSEALLKNLEKRRIDLVSLRRGYESQEQTVRAAILAQFPKISLGISNTRDYGDFLTLGPALTIDLPIFDRNQGAIATERATRKRLYDEYIARVFEARSSVVRAVTLIESLNRLIRAQDAEVASLRTLVNTDEKALKMGNVDMATYYPAAVSLSTRQLDAIKLRQDLVHAEISLELAAGTVLPIDSSLQEPGQ